MITNQIQDQEHVQFTRENARATGPYLLCENPPHYLTTVDFADIPELVRILNINMDVYNGSAHFQFPYLESHAQDRIGKALEHITNHGYNTTWAMRTHPNGPLIGWAHAHFKSDFSGVHPETGKKLKLGDIGYWVSPEYIGKGYASRAARYIVNEIMFKEYDCDIVQAEAYTHNIPSRKVLEAIGMRCEIEAKTIFVPKLQEQRLICCYSIHRDDSTKSVPFHFVPL
ncbi:hypothetical protein BGZ51_006106 [Haplosporangium sp. Z 767]|nr:hypothetical protein BGZ50_006153 [Haplosporangium sp. Z 11]KAF9180550.1 hypothetical protein BGZ51_006106 [Haplosporangium sp. Z 767]